MVPGERVFTIPAALSSQKAAAVPQGHADQGQPERPVPGQQGAVGEQLPGDEGVEEGPAETDQQLAVEDQVRREATL